jgi:hypothetical protein
LKHAVIVEPLFGEESQIVLQSGAILATPPESGEIGDTKSQKRAAVVNEGVLHHPHQPCAWLNISFELWHLCPLGNYASSQQGNEHLA